MILDVGFTGTRHGMTLEQRESVRILLLKIESGVLHHGDCVGGDEEVHALGRGFGYRIIGHPPTDHSRRAFCNFDEVRPEKPYLERNLDIVLESATLIAAPESEEESVRSGTWSTVRRAREHERTIFVVLPSGLIRAEST